MIVVELKGGLGNQMFQYASALGMASHSKQKLYVNREWFDAHKDIDSPREYELDCFLMEPHFKKKSNLLFIGERRSLKKLLNTRISQFNEPKFTFNKEALSKYDVWLDGFWQSEKYFANIRKQILDEFRFKPSVKNKNVPIIAEVKKQNSVSVHVRRGDYVGNKVHGTASLAYYKKSADYIGKRVTSPHFFVISDDSEWCKKNISLGYPTTFIESSSKGCYDMYIMSQCKHNIVANSSFSWWGAWLNAYTKKIVIAPKKWFQDGTMNSEDLIPSEWVRI